jgi:hypothetical protein
MDRGNASTNYLWGVFYASEGQHIEAEEEREHRRRVFKP